MDHGRSNLSSQPAALGTSDDEYDGNERFTARVDITANLRDAILRAATRQERLIVRRGDDELAAIIPIEDLDLLLRLEEEEEDRIDIEQARKALSDPENQTRIPWKDVKGELGL